MGDLIAEIVFWIIGAVLKRLFKRAQDPSKETRQTQSSGRPEQQDRLSTALKAGSAAAAAKRQALKNEAQSAPDDTHAALLPGSPQHQVSNVWEEYRKKQDAIQKAQDAKAPKPQDLGGS
jgi:hypothetical protein